MDIKPSRKLLGITQGQLAAAAGLTVGHVDRAERAKGDRRGYPSDHPVMAQLREALARLKAAPVLPATRSAPSNGVRARLVTERVPGIYIARVTLCPDVGCWMTQRGCEGLVKRHGVCRSMRQGRGCRGVRYRRGLEKREVTVHVEKSPT